jgi:Tol biopolymer transport system component
MADQDADEVFELYSAPIGGGSWAKLSGPLVAEGDVQSYDFSPDGQWIVYLADQDVDEVYELYQVPADGSAEAEKISAPLISNGDVNWFQFSPDGGRLVYYADGDVDERYEIYGLDFPGPGAVDKINDSLAADNDVYDFSFSPDGATLLYLVYDESDEQAQLYSVALPDGEPVKLNDPLAADESVGYAEFSPDGSYVLYYQGNFGIVSRFDSADVASGSRIYRVNPDGSGDPQLIIGEEMGNVADFRITPDSSRIVFAAFEGDVDFSERELYAVAATGGTPAKLNGPLVEGGGIDSFQLSPDSSRVVYWADQEINEVVELYAAAIPTEPEPEPGESVYLPVAIR